MSNSKRPGENTGKNGGIFQEQGPRGGKVDNFATVADGKPLPPTTRSGNTWIQTERTPDSKR